MKCYPLEEVKDKLIGEPGTPERIEYEARLKKDIQKAKMTKQQIETEVNHIFESGANETRVIEMIERIVSNLPQPHYQKINQLCPKCDGEGICDGTGSTTNLKRLCPVCNGSKTLIATIFYEQFS